MGEKKVCLILLTHKAMTRRMVLESLDKGGKPWLAQATELEAIDDEDPSSNESHHTIPVSDVEATPSVMKIYTIITHHICYYNGQRFNT